MHKHLFGIHPVVKRLGRSPLIFSNARSITLPIEDKENEMQKRMAWSPLVRSSDESWGESNLTNLKGIAKDSKDVEGPHNLAVSVERGFVQEDGSEAVSRVFIIGSSVIASNRKSVGYDHQANTDFLSNAVNYLTGREEVTGISIRRPEQVKLTLSRSEMKWILILILPTRISVPSVILTEE